MYVMSASETPPASPLPGVAHRTLARRGEGLEALSVWKETIAPGKSTPPHHHECEEVVVVLAGAGTLFIDGRERSFQAGDTLVLPARLDHQIVNSGTTELTMVATFSTSPVVTAAPSGEVLDLPWAS